MYTSTLVKIYYQYTLIACHTRDRTKYRYTTDENHLALQHRFLGEWTPEKFITQATDIHENVALYFSKVLEHKVYPEQAYKSCSGILSFARRVGPQRLTDACRLAEKLGRYNYPVIEEILNKRLDQIPIEQEEPTPAIPSDDNIRGKDYYQ